MNLNTLPKAAPCVNPPAVLAFLQSFDPDGWHNLVAIHPVTPQVTAHTFAPGLWEDMREWITARNTSGLNVYFTVNEVRPETGDHKPGKMDIARIRAVWIDVDPPKDKPYAEGRWAIEKTLRALPSCPCPPTHLVDSGCKRSGACRTNFRRMPGPSAWAEGQGRALKAEFGGDAVQNIDRIMRVPGTVNWPTPAKRDRGQPPRLAVACDEFLYDLMGVKWPPPLHRWEALARWFPPVIAPAHTDNDAEIAAVQAEIDLGVAQNGLPSGFLPRLLDVVKRSPVLLSALTGDIKGKDTSSSAHRAVVVARLRAAGPFTPTDYATLVFNLDHCQGDRGAMPEEWWRRQLARDWVNVGKSHDPATWFQPLDDDPEDPEGDEPGSGDDAAVRIKGSFDIPRRGDITPWIGCKPVPVPFVIDDFVEQGAVTLLAGEGGAGKSYVRPDRRSGRGDRDALLRQDDTAGAGRVPVRGRLPGGHSYPSGPAVRGHRHQHGRCGGPSHAAGTCWTIRRRTACYGRVAR